MEKLGRGEYKSFVHQDKNVQLTKWQDNKQVTVGSNFQCDSPADECQRWSAVLKAKITVKRPNAIADYNKHMGGTDNMDQAINVYKPIIRNRKWYWPLFIYILQVSVYNAWKLSRKLQPGKNGKMSFLQFTRDIVSTYLILYKKKKRTGKTNKLFQVRGVAKRVNDTIRYDGIGHLLGKLETRTRCALCGLHTLYYCTKCDVKLHTKCFEGLAQEVTEVL